MLHLATESRPPVRRDRLLRLPDVIAATGLKKTALYGLMRQGRFPRAVKIAARCVAWPESEVLAFVQERIAAAGRQAEAFASPESAEGNS